MEEKTRTINSLPEYLTKSSRAIERCFCEPFDHLKREPMSENLFRAFIGLMFLDKDENSSKELSKELKSSFGYQVISKRLEHVFSFTMSVAAKAFLSYLTNDNPGEIVMYLTYLQYKMRGKANRNIDMNELAEIFPNGFPSKESLHEMWLKQKVEATPDNLIDHLSAMQSLFDNKVEA